MKSRTFWLLVAGAVAGWIVLGRKVTATVTVPQDGVIVKYPVKQKTANVATPGSWSPEPLDGYPTGYELGEIDEGYVNGLPWTA